MATLLTLHLMGQPWWCTFGDYGPWSAADTPHNSQHLADPYTLTHVLHGILLYVALWGLLRRLAPSHRYLLAMALESAWEIFENTDFVIDRYRTTTISMLYHGDSVLNSFGDIAACAAGYGAAMLLPVWGSVAIVVVTEALLLVWIRDSLLLNVVMLLYPAEWLKRWQLGG